MTWLVLASEHDTPARWAADRLQQTGLNPIMFVTDTDFARATWRHQVGDNRMHTAITLRDGRVIDTDDVQGALNRLVYVPPSLLIDLNAEDRTYGMQELTALMLSWLHSLSGPVLNRPDPRGIGGAWRSPAEWALLVEQAGLTAAPVADSFGESESDNHWQYWPPYAPIAEDILVVGDEVFASRDLTTSTVEACRKLAKDTSTAILGIACERDLVVGVTPLPDLRVGGDELISALASALEES